MDGNTTAPPQTSITQATPEKSAGTSESTLKRAETTEDTPEQKEYRLTQQFQDWVMYFTTKGHYVEINGQQRKTYGNRAMATIKAYDLDPVKQYNVACSMGSQNFRKLKEAGSMFAEDLGLDYDKMLEIGKAKMGEKGTKMWELMMDTLGYRDIVPDTQIYNDNRSVTVNGEQAKDFNAAFKRFLEQE